MNLNTGEHITVLGKTGEGKTVLLQYLLTHYNRAIVYDIEGLDGYEYIPLAKIVINIEELKEALKEKTFRLVYRIQPEDIIGNNMYVIWNNICRLAFDIGSCAVFCDEISFTQHNKMHIEPYANAIIMLGRKRYVNFVIASRRNQEIHNAYITQSDHYFIFRLQPYDINAYVDKIPYIEMAYGLPKYHSLYINASGEYKILTPMPQVVNPINRQKQPNEVEPIPEVQPEQPQPPQPQPDWYSKNQPSV